MTMCGPKTRIGQKRFGRRLCALLLAVCLATPTLVMAQPNDPKKEKAELAKAAAFFEEGQHLYAKGRYAEAITAYRAAHAIAPHPSALFNIARCFENLADPVQALKYYEQTLTISTDPESISDIRGRITRLRTRPTKVFVSTVPAGAAVTVDGRQDAEPGVTPLVLHLKPGEHVLLLRKDGFSLAAKRLMVELGKEQPVQVKLDELPAACPPQKVCPPRKKCPKLKLTDTYKLHLNMSVMGAFGFQHKRPMSGGPGVSAFVTIKNVIVGPTFLFFPGGETPLSPVKDWGGVSYDRAELRWILAMAEAGYAFTFDTSYIYVVGGVGLSLDQIISKGIGKEDSGEKDKEGKIIYRDVEKSLTEQEPAFAWTVGAGVEGFATSWLSLGAAFRFGFIHGTRLDAENPGETDKESSFPMGTVWGTVTLHL